MASGLFGIEHTNRQDNQHWTKNCFNSSFPTSLACYMMERNIPAIYARLDIVAGELKVVCDEIPINELFRCGTLRAQELEFDFEAKFNRPAHKCHRIKARERMGQRNRCKDCNNVLLCFWNLGRSQRKRPSYSRDI